MKGLVSKVFAKTAFAALAGILVAASTPAVAGGRHCEKKVDGKWTELDGVKDRKECKKKGGKWVKDHDHQHDGSEDHDHEHEED
jgi:hypothetical protein